MAAFRKSNFRMKRVVQFLLVLFLAGCSHAPMAYHLRREGLDPVLFPPTKVKETNTTAEIHITLKNTRARSDSDPRCAIDGDVLSLRWQGTTAAISLHPKSFFASAADQASNQ